MQNNLSENTLNKCEKLGSVLHFEKPLEKFINKAVFRLYTDFYLNEVYINNKKVLLNKFADSNDDSISHILKLNEENIPPKKRKIRAKIAPQIRKLLELVNKKECCNEILIWNRFDSKSKNHKIYIFCKNTRLMIILFDKKNYYYLRTAYYVDEIWRYDNYLNQYKWNKHGFEQ